MKKLNLPNRLTVLRMILVPVLLVFMMTETLWGSAALPRIISALLFILSALTDMFDGMIARKRDQITDLGKFLDPIADKMLVLSTMMAFCASPVYSYIRLWAFIAGVLVLTRELVITSLRLMMASKNTVVAASWHGKFKTVSQTVFVATAIIEPLFGYKIYVLTYATLAVMSVMTLISGFMYLKQYLPAVMEESDK